MTESNRISVDAYEDWRSNCSLGSIYVFHRGLLSRDCLDDSGLDWLASRVYRKYENGRVVLVQKRLGENEYEYRAIATNNPPIPDKLPPLSAAMERERA